MQPVELRGPRVTLSAPGAEDIPALVAACQDPEIARWTSVPVPYTEESAHWWVSEHAPRLWADNGAAWTIRVDGALAGVLTLIGRSFTSRGWASGWRHRSAAAASSTSHSGSPSTSPSTPSASPACAGPPTSATGPRGGPSGGWLPFGGHAPCGTAGRLRSARPLTRPLGRLAARHRSPHPGHALDRARGEPPRHPRPARSGGAGAGSSTPPTTSRCPRGRPTSRSNGSICAWPSSPRSSPSSWAPSTATTPSSSCSRPSPRPWPPTPTTGTLSPPRRPRGPHLRHLRHGPGDRHPARRRPPRRAALEHVEARRGRPPPLPGRRQGAEGPRVLRAGHRHGAGHDALLAGDARTPAAPWDGPAA